MLELCAHGYASPGCLMKLARRVEEKGWGFLGCSTLKTSLAMPALPWRWQQR
jgi:hypothetical protein